MTGDAKVLESASSCRSTTAKGPSSNVRRLDATRASLAGAWEIILVKVGFKSHIHRASQRRPAAGKRSKVASEISAESFHHAEWPKVSSTSWREGTIPRKPGLTRNSESPVSARHAGW
jgi:hypothetical protein